MKSAVCLMVALAGLSVGDVLFAQTVSSNLVENPGFETGTFDGWTELGGSRVSDDYLRTGTFGVWIFDGPGAVYQDVDVSAYAAEIDAGLARIDAGGWVGGFSDVYFSRIYLDGSDNVLVACEVFGHEQPMFSIPYLDLGIDTTPPAGTRTVRLYFEVKSSSQYADAGFDDAYLYVTTLEDVLPAPVLLTPLDGSIDVSSIPTLSWSSVSGADRYRVLLSTNLMSLPTSPEDSTCDDCDASGINGLTDLLIHTAGDLFPISGSSETLGSGDTCYWVVQSLNSDGTLGNYSPVGSFVVTGAVVSGSVTGPDTLTPLGNIDVTLWLPIYIPEYFETDYIRVSTVKTDGDGNYIFRGLKQGTYRIEFNSSDVFGLNGFYDDVYLPEVYNDAPNLESGTDLVVLAESVTTGINASLSLASEITGTVTASDGITGLAGIDVRVYAFNQDVFFWEDVGGTITGNDGSYVIGGLLAGTYRIEFSGNDDYVKEYYDNTGSIDLADDIVVSESEVVSGIDASLADASRITGTVTASNGGAPLAGIQVYALTYNSDYGFWDTLTLDYTDADGTYSLGGLGAGNYRVHFIDGNQNYIDEYYDNASNPDDGLDVVLPPTSTVSGIDAALDVASRITGSITGPDGITPLEGIFAELYRWDGFDWVDDGNFTLSESDGSYTFGGLGAGTYRIQFSDFFMGDYASEAYDDAVDILSGTDIIVPAGMFISNINASLAYSDPPVLQTIAGLVTGPDGVTPLQGIEVRAVRWNSEYSYWQLMGTATTGADGSYTISGLDPDTYRIQFYDISGIHVHEVYDNASDYDAGADIVLTSGADVEGIDASLALADPDMDGDGIDDAWEAAYFTNMNVATTSSDYDGDGFLDLHEFLAGSLPDNSNSLLLANAVTYNESGDVIITWQSHSNRVYSILCTTNLLEAFSLLATNIAATPPSNTYTDASPQDAQAIYNIDVRAE